MKIFNRWTKELIIEIDLKNASNSDLRDSNLRDSDLRDSDLSHSNLSGSDLSHSNLSDSNLSDSNLRDSNLRDSNLSGSNLSHSDLRDSNLSDSNLSGSNLSDSNLRDSDLTNARLTNFLILPDGDLIVYKKLKDGIICKLKIPANIKRINSLIGRKCRAERAIVLEGEGFGQYSNLEYKIGQEVIADSFDEDIRIECSHGIHFFITKKEAEEY